MKEKIDYDAIGVSAEVPADGPVIMTLTGDAGIGKTSTAATFPNPVG